MIYGLATNQLPPPTVLEEIRRFQLQSEDEHASAAEDADEDEQPPQQSLSAPNTPNRRTTRSNQGSSSPRKRRRNDLSDDDQDDSNHAPSTPPPLAALPQTPATPATPYNTRFKGVKRVRVSEKQISPTASELESAVRRSESKEDEEQSWSDDDGDGDDDGFGEEVVPSRPRRSAREKGNQQDQQKSPKSYFDSQARPEVTQGQKRAGRATVYRGRGRPRKSDLQTGHKSRPIPPAEKRPRGRPRKDSVRAGDRVAVDLARAITLSHASAGVTGQGDVSMGRDGDADADADAEGDTDHEVDAVRLGPEEESPTHPSTSTLAAGTRKLRHAQRATTSQGGTTLPVLKRGRGRPRNNTVTVPPTTHEEGTSGPKQTVYVSVPPRRTTTSTRPGATANVGKLSHAQAGGHVSHLPGSLFEGVFLPPPITGKRVITSVAAAGIGVGIDGGDAPTSTNVDLGAGAGVLGGRPVLKERKDLSGGPEGEGEEREEETQRDEVPPSDEHESEQGQEQEQEQEWEPNPDHAPSTDVDFELGQDIDPVLAGLAKGDTLSSLAGSNKGKQLSSLSSFLYCVPVSDFRRF